MGAEGGLLICDPLLGTSEGGEQGFSYSEPDTPTSPDQIHTELMGSFSHRFPELFEPYPKMVQKKGTGIHNMRSGEGERPHR